MAVLPESSSASLLRGAWFVFRLDGHSVHAWFSVTTGRSRIYVDGDCVHVGRCFRRRGGFDVAFAEQPFRINFSVARQGRLYVTLRKPDGDESTQCAGFQVPRWAWGASVLIDLVSAYFLMMSVYEDTMSAGLALISFLAVIFLLTSVERCVFGRLRIVDTAPRLA